MTPTLPTHLSLAQSSTERALADIAALQQAAEAARASIQAAMQQAHRAAKLTGEFDQAELKEFLQRPYALRPVGQGKYELIVPRFTGFRAGWPVRADGAYNVYEVSRFTHLMSPLPDWMAQELGYTAPTWNGTLDGTTLTVTAGDVEQVAQKLGKAVARRSGNTLTLKPASRFDVLRRIIREEGFLPYTPAPLPPSLFREPLIRQHADSSTLSLRPHQREAWETFQRTGSISLVAFMQTGKSFVPLWAFACIKGPKLLLFNRRALKEQWRERIEHYLTPEAASEITLSTYQSAGKHLNKEYALVVFDEGHHVPANFALDTAASVSTLSRMLLSASPFREDGNDDLIIALGGWPIGMDWPVSKVQRPRVSVFITLSEASKLPLVEKLIAQPTPGKTLVFSWRLEIGEQFARRLEVPFITPKTKKPLDVIRAHDVVVLSSVGDAGLSIPASRVIDVNSLFGSRNQTIQRYGRGANDWGQKRAGEHYILMTPHEYEQYGKRLWAFERYGTEVEITDLTNGRAASTRAAPSSTAPARPRPTSTRPARPITRKPDSEPLDEIARTLEFTPIAVKLRQANAKIKDPRAVAAVPRILRLCWFSRMSIEDMLLKQGFDSQKSRKRYKSACSALRDVGLLSFDGEGWKVVKSEIERLSKLAGA